MAKLRRGTHSAFADDASMRLRAAWLYHGHGLTQNEVAEKLGIARSTTVRLLEEAKKRGEVKIWIEDGIAELVELAVNLEREFGLDEVIVVPNAKNQEQTNRTVGLALGKFLSDTISDNMTIGVGWGRTLTASLASFHPAHHSGVKVMSLLGGAVETRFANPVEFAWKVAAALHAECFLFPAPLIVNSAETKQSLILECGLAPIYQLAQTLDLVVVSVGDINPHSTSLTRHMISEKDHQELLDLGCVGDVMCNFIDAAGRVLDHPLHKRTMSIDLATLRKAGHRVLATGGKQRAEAVFAAIKAVKCQTLITDEDAAKEVLSMGKAAGRDRKQI